MVRSKGSIVVKDKSLATKAQEEEKTPKMYANRFANEIEQEYAISRYLLSDSATHLSDLRKDLAVLEADH